MEDEPLTIIVVDDDPDMLKILTRYLRSPERRILAAKDARQALAWFGEEPVHLILTDLMMPDMDGLELTLEVKRRNPMIPVIIVTAYASIESAVKAMKVGAYDYITKPVIPEELRIKVEKALEQFRLQEEVSSLKEQLSRDAKIPCLIEESPAMRKVLNIVSLVSRREVPVALFGESGTGKEVLARTIHQASPRVNRTFVPVNCGALPETLLESELFGFTKGAFTGAVAAKRGLFEEADGGTLFLDEIADAPPSIQMKLLRTLQEGEIRRLGSTRTVNVDVRIICASNKPLEDEIAAGRFREDLYYRLAVVTIQVPPLRERVEDIPLLADHFVEQYRKTINPEVVGISQEAREALQGYEWPGNVRELENMIRRGLVLCRGEWLTLKEMMLPKSEGEADGFESRGFERMPFSDAQRRFQYHYFVEAMRRNRGKVPAVAEEAGISRKGVYDHLRRLGIEPAKFRGR